MNQQQMFVASLVGLAVSAAVLIVIVPSLFVDGGAVPTWVVGALVVLVVTFGIGTRRWRPSPPR